MNCVNLQNTRKIMLFKDSRTKSLSNHLKQTTLHQSQSQLKWLRGHKLHAFICWNNQFDILVGQHRRQTNNKLVMETNRFLVAFTFVRDPSLSRENILDCIVWVNCWSHFYTLVLIFFFQNPSIHIEYFVGNHKVSSVQQTLWSILLMKLNL